jgi:hypothetical protein
MSSFRLLPAVGFALLLASCAAAPAAETGWRRIFDGASLDGWTPKVRGFPAGENYAGTFRAENGAIVVSYENYEAFGDRFGHLFFNEAVSAPFSLRLEYRFLDGGPADTPGWAIANSGIMIFGQSPESMALDDSFPVSVEAQLLGAVPGQARSNGNMCSPGTHVVINGELVTRHCVNSAIPAAAPDGRWIRFRIDVDAAGAVTQTVDDTVSIAYSAAQLDPAGGMGNSPPLIAARGGEVRLSGGTLSLQSEGAPIAFRRIELRQGGDAVLTAPRLFRSR